MKYPIKRLISEAPFWMRLPRILKLYKLQPLFLLIHLTGRCDCSCSFCYQRKEFYGGNRVDMSLDNFHQIMQQAKGFFIRPRIHFIGGEPLVHESISDIIDLVSNYKLRFSITTNASRLDIYAEPLCLAGLSEINISLDGVEGMHDLSRNHPGLFQKVINGIKKLREQPDGKRVWVNISCLVDGAGPENALLLCNYLSNFGFGFIDSFSLQSKHSANGVVIKKGQFESASKGYFRVFTPKIKKKGFCELPWMGTAVLPDLSIMPGGAVLVCNTLVGDVRSGHLREVWLGNKFEKYRKSLLKSGLPPGCDKCCHMY